MRPRIDLRGATFDRFVAHAFDHDDPAWHVVGPLPVLDVDPRLQLEHAERLFRNPSAVASFSPAQREQGFWFLPGSSQPEFFSGQLWNHDLPIGARISCASAMQVLYRDLFAIDPHGEDAYMWFDQLDDARLDHGACAACEPVRRAIIGALEVILAIPACEQPALHGLNHWGTDAERASIIDRWLPAAPPGKLRDYALLCREGKAE
ncbi:MAG: hypothetical protein ABR567_02330 [Myxococcales bacterium]|nr:hypothetical protein [Myxococcales bacterium]